MGRCSCGGDALPEELPAEVWRGRASHRKRTGWERMKFLSQKHGGWDGGG